MPDSICQFEGFQGPNYTQVPDEFFSRLLPVLGEAEIKVLLYIFRHTFGYKKAGDRISLSQFTKGIVKKDGSVSDKGCGISSRRSVVAALQSLESRGIIVSQKSKSPGGDPDVTTYMLNMGGQKVVAQVHHLDEEVVAESNQGSSPSEPQVVAESNQGSSPSEPQQYTSNNTKLNNKQFDNNNGNYKNNNSKDDPWTPILAEVQRQVPKASFEAWLINSRFLRRAENNTIVIGVPRVEDRDCIERRLGFLIGRVAIRTGVECVLYEVEHPP